MKERPILFSGPMVRAILDGRKTQTRRVVKPQPVWIGDPHVPFKTSDADPRGIIKCPYGSPSDHLWVRESWYELGRWARVSQPEQPWEGDTEWRSSGKVAFAADGPNPGDWRSRPSIHLPRKFSRIILEVTGVRIERLQDISEADCIAEGVSGVPYLLSPDERPPYLDESMAKCRYRLLWESINDPGSWDANPYVWVIEFKQVID